MSSFWQFFDIQMPIFRRVRCGVYRFADSVIALLSLLTSNGARVSDWVKYEPKLLQNGVKLDKSGTIGDLKIYSKEFPI